MRREILRIFECIQPKKKKFLTFEVTFNNSEHFSPMSDFFKKGGKMQRKDRANFGQNSRSRSHS